MEIRLLEDERIDDLERNGYRIIQNKKGFCFGIDAVLLSGFMKVKSSDRVMDLGTGTGILPLLIRAKYGARDITGLELQEDSADMAARSVALNKLEEDIKIVCGDIREADRMFEKCSFDVVCSNPPYMKNNGGIENPDERKAIARHEIKCSFEDVAYQAAALLKNNGKFFLVHRPEQLARIMEVLRSNALEPKRMRLVHSYADDKAVLVLIEASKGGNTFMKVENPLIIYKEKNVYSDEIKEIYGF